MAATPLSRSCPIRIISVHLLDAAGQLLRVLFLDREGHIRAQPHYVPREEALLSFSYNCGPHWFGSPGYTTLTGHLRNQAWELVPAALMLYVNTGGPSEAGLRRRRKAAAALWSASPIQGKAASPDRVTSKPPAGGGVIQHPNPPVGVPRFQQRDSAQLSQRDRTCFSSSCAMLLEAIKPGTLKGANGDDQYLAVVQRFGDTTDANAQLRIDGIGDGGGRCTAAGEPACAAGADRPIDAGRASRPLRTAD